MRKTVKQSNLSMRDVLLAKSWTRSIYHQKDMLDLMNTADLKAMVIGWMLDWVVQPGSETILDFCNEYKIPRSTLFYWVANDTEFKAIYENVKLVLGNKLYKMALHKLVDKEVAFKPMHDLDPQYLEFNKYHAALKKEEGGNLGDRLAQALLDREEKLAPFEEKK